MRHFGIMLLMIAVLMVVGLSVFGNVNEFETKPLMAEALMFPTERTTEMLKGDSVNHVAYAESVSLIKSTRNHDGRRMDYYNSILIMVEVTPAHGHVGGAAVHLIYPFPRRALFLL